MDRELERKNLELIVRFLTLDPRQMLIAVAEQDGPRFVEMTAAARRVLRTRIHKIEQELTR